MESRFKKRLDHLRDHHKKCSEKYTKYINAQQEHISDCDSNVMTVTGEPPPMLEDPEVPPLERTDSIFLSQDYLDQLSKMSDELETLSSCVEWTDDEFVPPKELMEESSSEGPVDVPAQRPMKRKNRKPHRTSKRAKRTITCSDKDSRSTENEKDTKTGKVSVMKLQKKEDGGRIYSNKHYCLYCPISCHKMARHLVRKHSSETAVAKAITYPLKSKERKLHFDLIRNKGDCAHNNEVLESGSGTLIPSQQASKPVNASDYMHCIQCQALLKRKALWRHMSRCRLSQNCSKQKPGRSSDSEVSDTEGDSSFCSPGAGSSTPQEKQNMESDSCSFESGTTNSNEKEHTVEPEKCPSKTGSLVTTWMMESDNDTPVKGASQKRSWSAVETRAVEKTLKNFIESGKVPGKADCVSCIEASPKELENRTWKAVKYYVKNKITTLKRNSAKRLLGSNAYLHIPWAVHFVPFFMLKLMFSLHTAGLV